MMAFTKGSEELRVVFQMCVPNEDGLISLRKLQELFEQHAEVGAAGGTSDKVRQS